MFEFNGKTYARVGDILNLVSDFSKIPPFILERKATIGKNVHAGIAADINEEFPVVSNEETGYLSSYFEWKKALGVQFIQSEQRYFCEEKMITGQIDALVLLNNDKTPILVDFKTSAKESKETWPLQAYFYSYLLTKNGVIHKPKYHFIKLNKMGQLPEIFIYEFSKEIHQKCMDLIEEFWKIEKNPFS